MKIIKILTITVLLLFLTIFFAGGGHGTYLPAKLIYPFTMLSAKSEIGTVGLILAILQIPIYALILEKKPKWKYYLIGVHLLAIIFCFSIKNSSF